MARRPRPRRFNAEFKTKAVRLVQSSEDQPSELVRLHRGARIARHLVIAVTVVFWSAPLFAEIRLLPAFTGLSSPVFVTNADDGSNRLFIIEQGGAIKVVRPGSTTPTTFLDIRTKVLSGGERGLLGLAFHPQYLRNGRFFVHYTRIGDGALVIAEYNASTNSDIASTTETTPLTMPHPGQANHNGGMLAFGHDGYLYIGVGDGGSGNDPPNNAQNTGVLLGKISPATGHCLSPADQEPSW